MVDAAADIRSALDSAEGLPIPVRSWVVEAGRDATDDPAVWIWAIVEPDHVDPDAMIRLKSMVRDVVRNTNEELWAYVLIRGVDEAAVAS